MKTTLVILLIALSLCLSACQTQSQTEPSDQFSKFHWKVLKMEYRPWKEVQDSPMVCWITVRNKDGVELEARSMGHFWDTEGEGSCNVQIGDYVEGTQDDLLYTQDKPPIRFQSNQGMAAKVL